MAQSLAQITIHVIFSTKDRRPFLENRLLREELHRYFGGILAQIDCQLLAAGGTDDHVHILCLLARTCTTADLVKELKRVSSIWLKTKDSNLHDFAWQSGYGIFSVSQSQIDVVRKYIDGQEEHHRKVSFQDEFRQFLERNYVAYDERYLWE